MDDIIARRKLSNDARKRKRGTEPEGDESEEDESEENEEDSSGSEVEDETVSDDEMEESDDPLVSTDEEGVEFGLSLDEQTEDEEEQGADDGSDSEGSDSEKETQADRERKAAYFAAPEDSSLNGKTTSFTTMSLSRPLLKAITALGFTTPTPIQAATIPVALLGKDVVGNAVTGSGKTAAFIIPVLERLMYRERGKNKAAVRCLVLVPTRELGVQCVDVARKLSAFMDVRTSLIVGMVSSTFKFCVKLFT